MTLYDLNGKTIYVGSQAIDRVYLGGELLKSNEQSNEPHIYIATDEDFKIDGDRHVYIGSALEVDITDYVNRKGLTDLAYMFGNSSGTTPATKIVLGPSSVTGMSRMFSGSQATILDLSSFDTGRVTDMSWMFYGSQATSLDLSSFDTSNVTSMLNMFRNSKATSLDLSSFDTSSVTDMTMMFRSSQATTLDLSSFDTSNVYGTTAMFRDSKATTGYARTQTDVGILNSSSLRPSGLRFVVK